MSPNWKNIKTMDNFLETCHISKLNQDQMINIKKNMITSEIQAMINFPNQ